jgi:hypothetical protein
LEIKMQRRVQPLNKLLEAHAVLCNQVSELETCKDPAKKELYQLVKGRKEGVMAAIELLGGSEIVLDIILS